MSSLDASAAILDELTHADLTVLGQLRTASNATLLCELPTAGGAAKCVYKPVAGERALWDFPDDTLGRREVLAYEVARAMGRPLIPPTVWREQGPYGAGMCQLWIDEGDREPVRVVPADSASGRVVIEGEDQAGHAVALVHEDADDVRRIAVFDAVVNNADRKGGHILADAKGTLWAIDHGVCFSHEPKLRTVLWGWAGESIDAVDLAALFQLQAQLDRLLTSHGEWMSEAEAEALRERLSTLLETGTFPEPTTEWPFLPWPVM